MKARVNIGLALLVIVMISPAIPGRMPVSDTWTGQNSPVDMPPPYRLMTLATPTPTPTPTPQPTSQSEMVFNLNEIYYFGGTGGNGDFCGTWEDVKKYYPASTKLPIVKQGWAILNQPILCAYGFLPERPVTIELYAPNGVRAVTLTHPPTKLPSAQHGRVIPLSLPYGLPYGIWTVVVKAGNRSAKNAFMHPPERPETINVTHLLPRDVLRPNDPRWYAPFKPGDRAAIYAAGYAPNSELLVVVTRPAATDNSDKYVPIFAWKARANSLGHLYLQFTIDSSYKEGTYAVFAGPYTDKPAEVVKRIRYMFRVYSPWHACKGAPLSNLHAGDRARLMPGPPNNVRNHPRLSGRLIGQIPAYQNVHVEDGPKCNNGMVWWYVEVYDSFWNKLKLEGWTAEGDTSGYWLIPIQ